MHQRRRQLGSRYGIGAGGMSSYSVEWESPFSIEGLRFAIGEVSQLARRGDAVPPQVLALLRQAQVPLQRAFRILMQQQAARGARSVGRPGASATTVGSSSRAWEPVSFPLSGDAAVARTNFRGTPSIVTIGAARSSGGANLRPVGAMSLSLDQLTVGHSVHAREPIRVGRRRGGLIRSFANVFRRRFFG